MNETHVSRNILFVAATVLVLAFGWHVAMAVPTEPVGPNTLSVVRSSRLANTSYGPKTTFAEAGNVTELAINATTASRAWQAYYGNVTGQLVLQDSSNNTIYDWVNLEPQGEVYASINTSINWPTIRCFNHTSDSGSGGFIGTTINASTENSRTNIANNDPDAINATFNRTTHSALNVGTVSIGANTCYMTWTYVSSASQTTDFVELLLTDGVPTGGGGNALVFAAIIENDNVGTDADVVGFDGLTHDFQMLVLEDGHDGGGEDTLTTYYFWVELQ